MNISPARIAAYEILLRIERDRAFSSVLLPQYESNLNEKDAGLCHQLVLGVLRRKLYLDRVIRDLAGNKKIDIEVLTALRIGAYQLLDLDRIPAHSAVNESVALVQRARKSSAKGFVNAILRRVSAGGRKPELGEGDGASVGLSHPRWLLDRWAQQFGSDRAVAIAQANNQPSRSAFRLTGKGNAKMDESVTHSEIVESAFTAPRITRDLRQLAELGEIYFQDEASQLVANMVSIPAGGRFLDLCASPGGKTSQIALRYKDDGVAVIAGDLHLKRVEFLRSNCLRQGASQVNVVQYDAAASLPFADESFDTILVDAPCSGTGTIAGNPEIRYFLKAEDIRELSNKQLLILRNASKLLKTGGCLYYSTCSLEREENEDVIAAFLADSCEFSTAEAEVDGRFRTSEGFGRTFPDREGTDGFFFAVLVKR